MLDVRIFLFVLIRQSKAGAFHPAAAVSFSPTVAIIAVSCNALSSPERNDWEALPVELCVILINLRQSLSDSLSQLSKATLVLIVRTNGGMDIADALEKDKVSRFAVFDHRIEMPIIGVMNETRTV